MTTAHAGRTFEVRPLAYLVFFTSGFSALLYQIVWQRLLLIFSGTNIHSVTIVVAAFMAGLGCGSFAGGVLADRLSRRGSLLLFAGAELAIGSFGLFSTAFYYHVLYERLASVPMGPAAVAGILFVSLLWPTFFMGMSLPLLGRALVVTVGDAAPVTGRLYGFNTLGAAAGALATWLLLPGFGLEGSLRLSAGLNMLAALVALTLVLNKLGLRAATRSSVDEEIAIRTDTHEPVDHDLEIAKTSFRACIALYALAGFLALSLEIVWFRLLSVMLKPNAFTFGTLLFVYLTGLGIGAAAASQLMSRARQPMSLFLWAQTMIGLYVGASVTLLIMGLKRWNWLRPLMVYFQEYEPFDLSAVAASLAGLSVNQPVFGQFVALHFGLPGLLIGPPTILMGASFPLLQKVVQTDLAHVGSRLGTLLMANIAGSTAGCVATGWLALTWFGAATTMKLLVAMTALFAIFGFLQSSGRVAARASRWGYGAAVAATAGVLVLMPGAGTLWARLHGTSANAIVHGEDGSGTSVLKMLPGSREIQVVVYVNGIGQSRMPYGGIHTVLGALPAFIHPNPRRAAVIGLGSGDTVFAMAGRGDLERITCVEIIRPQILTLRQLSGRLIYPGLMAALGDPRIEHTYGDGRVYLMREQERYDIIEADALRPTSAYAGNLYSDSYFALLRDRLNRGGLAVSWSPTPRVHNTFVKVFPYVLSYGDIVLGSNDPIQFVPHLVRARLMDPRVLDYYARAGIDIRTLLASYLDSVPVTFTPSSDRAPMQDINTDLFPKDEFGVR